MKKSEFRKLVRPLIKEELYKILGEVLPSLLSEVVAEQMVPEDNTSSTQGQPHRRSQLNKPPVQFSSNPLLNEVLTQTQGGISDGSEMVGLSGQMDMVGDQETPMMGHTVGFDSPTDDGQYSAGEHGQKIELQELQQVAPGVASALTRDYSSLMKAVDKKKTSTQPSNIDFANLHG